MRTRPVILLTFLCLLLGSCGDFDREPVITRYKPTLIDRTDLEKSVTYSGPKSLKKPGKIYFYNDYIFISEQYKGVHVIDNRHPESPVRVGFINVPGCLDMAVKENILYADNAIDMVCIDISDMSKVKEVNRVRNVFPEITPPDGLQLPDEFTPSNRPKNTVIIDWN